MNDEDELFGARESANERDDADTASEVSEGEEVAERQAAEGEELYSNGPAMPKRRRGRPTKQEAAREKVRLRVERWRARQIRGIQKTWAANLTNLDETERNRLLAQQKEVAVLSALMNDVIAGNLDPGYLRNLFLEIQHFISRPGCGLVRDWITDLSADTLTADQWSRFDDEQYKQFGVRTRIWKLQLREFLRWITSSAAVEPELANEAAGLLAPMDPPKEIRVAVPVPPVFQSERARQAAIEAKELAQSYQQREIENYERWQARQLGSRLEEK